MIVKMEAVHFPFSVKILNPSFITKDGFLNLIDFTGNNFTFRLFPYFPSRV